MTLIWTNLLVNWNKTCSRKENNQNRKKYCGPKLSHQKVFDWNFYLSVFSKSACSLKNFNWNFVRFHDCKLSGATLKNPSKFLIRLMTGYLWKTNRVFLKLNLKRLQLCNSSANTTRQTIRERKNEGQWFLYWESAISLYTIFPNRCQNFHNHKSWSKRTLFVSLENCSSRELMQFFRAFLHIESFFINEFVSHHPS